VGCVHLRRLTRLPPLPLYPVTECPHYNATDGKYLKGDGTDLACAGTGFTVAFANKVEGSGDTPCDDVRGEHRRAHRPPAPT